MGQRGSWLLLCRKKRKLQTQTSAGTLAPGLAARKDVLSHAKVKHSVWRVYTINTTNNSRKLSLYISMNEFIASNVDFGA